MNRFILVIACLIVILLAWGATQIGGIDIRRVELIGVQPTLELSEPAVPGVGVRVHWNVLPEIHDQSVLFEVRTLSDTWIVGQANYAAGQAKIQLGCSLGGESANLLMIEDATEQLIARIPIEVLPAGPDCLL